MFENVVSWRVTGIPPLLAAPKEAPENFIEMWNAIPGWGQLTIFAVTLVISGFFVSKIAGSFGFSKGWLERDDVARADRAQERRSRGH